MLSPRTTYRLIGGLSGAPFGTRTGRAGDLFDELLGRLKFALCAAGEVRS